MVFHLRIPSQTEYGVGRSVAQGRIGRLLVIVMPEVEFDWVKVAVRLNRAVGAGLLGNPHKPS